MYEKRNFKIVNNKGMFNKIYYNYPTRDFDLQTADWVKNLLLYYLASYWSVLSGLNRQIKSSIKFFGYISNVIR